MLTCLASSFSSAGELGFVASLTLRGAPPFRLTYSVAAQSSSPSIRTKVIQSLQEELTFQEDNEGTYTYRFISIADKNYPLGIDLDGERKIEDVVQVVHPLAKAEMVGKAKKVMWECEGGEVVAEVELKVRLVPSIPWLCPTRLTLSLGHPPVSSTPGQSAVHPHRHHHIAQGS